MSFDETSELGKALERERVLFRRFEELRRSAAEMRMILAHDIKSPLAVMTGAADLLSAGQGRLTEERRTNLLGALLKSVDQIQGLVSTGDLEAITGVVKPVVVDLAAAARRVSDVEVEGTGEIYTYHPDIVEALLQHLSARARRLLFSNDGDWVVLTISEDEATEQITIRHLVEMLGGKLEGSQLRLPCQPP